MEMSEVFAFGCIFVFTAIGLVCDLKTRKLPNALTVPALCIGLLYHVSHGFWLGSFSGAGSELLFALKGFAVAFSIMFALWILGGIAGGDLKFVVALGCWLGAWLIVQVFVLSTLLSASISAGSSIKKTFQLKRTRRSESATRADQLRKKKEAVKESAKRPATQHGWQVAFGVPVAIVTWILLSLQLAGIGLRWPG
jgi:prepilin peptidase CpaA